MIRVGIDASNIKEGGGLTHLRELIEHYDLAKPNSVNVIIWGGGQLNAIKDFEWLKKVQPNELQKGGIFWESFWKIFKRNKTFKKECDILFVPGGVFSSTIIPYVSMSQNMLVFEKRERRRYGISWNRLRLKLLNFLQKKSFNNASGLIFISQFASEIILPKIKTTNFRIIHHGISDRFNNDVKEQKHINLYQSENPFKLLYISTINVYKHQWKVAEAVAQLREEQNIAIEVNFVGWAHKTSLVKLNTVIEKYDRGRNFLKYHGKIPYEEIEQFYHESDAFIFASTCENMPNILIEAMYSGLPVLSSNKKPMPEFLKEAGFYFNPYSVDSIKKELAFFILNPELREHKADEAKKYAQNFSWEKCAIETFDFILETYNNGYRREH